LQNLSTKAVGHLSPIIKVLRIEMKTCQPLFVGDCSPLFYLSQPSTGGARYRGLHDRPLSDPCRTGPASRVLVDPRGTRGNETEVRTSAKLWDPDLAAWRFYIPSRTIKGIFRRDIERELAAVYESHDIADEHAERVVSSLFGDQNRRGFVDFTEGVVKAAGAEREGKVSYSNDTVPTDLLVPGHRGRLITSNSLCRWKQASLSSRRTGGLRTYLAVAEGAGFTFEVRLRCNAPWLESMIRNTLGRLTSGTLRFGARGKDGCGLVSLVSLDAVYRGGIATAAGVDADELEQVLRALVSSA